MLTKQETKRLKEEAHFLKPELNIGKEGFSTKFTESLYQAFNKKELLKIKYLDNSPEDRASVKEKLSTLEDITLVHQIGHTFVLYKKLEK